MPDDKMTWWREAKFGMFIHWGLYVLLAGAYRGQETDNIAEWIMHDLHIPVEEYERLAAAFDPIRFDADGIVRLCRNTGMKYLVFTAKHHDGFAMYHSKVSPYNIVDATPFGRDVAMELKDACDKHGIRLCFYYSQAQDWHHPGGFEEDVPMEGKDFERYLQGKCIPQVRELLTHYGDIGLIWYDTPMDMSEADARRLRDLVYELQPDCLVSGRVGYGLGDYMTTGDNFIPLLPYPGDFEVPATINGTWGFSNSDIYWKSPEKLLRNLVKIVSRGGNYLLNIGPDALGQVPAKSVQALQTIGDFMRLNAESIYGTRPTPVYPYDIDWGYFTSRAYKLYIHVFEDQPEIYLLNMGNTPVRATLLADGRELELRQRLTCEHDHSWRIFLPEDRPPQIDTVIRVEVEEEGILFEAIKA